MAKSQSTIKLANKETPKTITPKPRKTRGEILLRQELDSLSVPVGIHALNDICGIHNALEGLRDLLSRGDEADLGISRLMKLPVKRLGEIVKEFPDLEKAFQQYRGLHNQAEKWYADREKGGAQ